MRVVTLDGAFVEAHSDIPHADNNDGCDDESDDESTHFSPPKVRLANKCRTMQARIQPIPPITIVMIGRLSRKLLILYMYPATGVAIPTVKHAVEALSRALARSLVRSLRIRGMGQSFPSSSRPNRRDSS